MNLKLLSLGIAFLFLVTLIPANTQAGYSMAISGKSDFLGTPYQAQVFNGSEVYVRIYLADTSPSSLLVTMTVEGDLGQYISFPEFTSAPSFTLFPGQNRKVLYKLSLPASAPGKYTGSILAVGNPPATETSTGAGAIGKPVVGITIAADVPSDVQIFNFANHGNGFIDQQWAVWGNGWSTNLSIVNGGNSTFNGWCNLTLSSNTVLESQSFNITNLTVAGNMTIGRAWQNNLPLNAQYVVSAVVTSDAGTKKDEEALGFSIPSPAEIISVSRSPEQIFFGDSAAIYSVLASSDSTVTLHYRVNNGTEATVAMAYASGEFGAAIPTQAMGATVQYWVTSVNGAFTDREPVTGAYSYYVFSPDVPDLTITYDNIFFSPIDPLNQTMNQTDVTNIFITVRNIGRGTASNVMVRVYDHEVPVWNTTITTLAGQGGSNVVRFAWSPTEGEHILRFEVDPDNAIVELNENNNHYTMAASTVGPTPPAPPPEETDTPVNIIPYIIIPIILAILIILLLRRKRTINVTVSEVKPFKHPKDGSIRWIYTCTYGKGHEIGVTKSTAVQAVQGAVIKVKPSEIIEEENGAMAWLDAVVVEVAEEADSEAKIRKLAKRKNE